MGFEWMKFEFLKSYTRINWMMFYGDLSLLQAQRKEVGITQNHKAMTLTNPMTLEWSHLIMYFINCSVLIRWWWINMSGWKHNHIIVTSCLYTKIEGPWLTKKHFFNSLWYGIWTYIWANPSCFIWSSLLSIIVTPIHVTFDEFDFVEWHDLRANYLVKLAFQNGLGCHVNWNV